ncbi:MAG: WD40 repeat domain-containing protein, partial [Nannocystaceae bacterium]
LDRRGHVRLLGLDANTNEVAAPILGTHAADVVAMAFAPDGGQLLTATSDHKAHLWSLDNQTSQQLAGHSQAITSIAFSGHGSQVLLGSADHSASLWDLTKPTPTSLVFRGHREALTAVALDATGGLAATASDDGALRVWNTKTQSATVLRTGGAAIHALAIDPAGAWLVSADAKGTMTRWPLSRVLAAPAVDHAHRGRVNAIVFHPDATRFATASEDQTVRLWPLDPDRHLAQPRVLHHTAAVRHLAFIDDGRKLVTTCEDGSIWTWPTVNSGKPSVRRAGELASLDTAITRPGGEDLATLHGQRQVRVWPQNPAKMVEKLWDLPVNCPTIADRQRLLGDDLEAATEAATACRTRLSSK